MTGMDDRCGNGHVVDCCGNCGCEPDTLREAVERLAADLVYADVPTWVVDRVHDLLATHPAPDAETAPTTREREAAICGCGNPEAHSYAPPSLPAGSDTAGERPISLASECVGFGGSLSSPAPEDDTCGCPDSRDCCESDADLTPIMGGLADDVEIVPSPAPADERERAHVLTADLDGETYAALIDAAHQEQRQAVAADRSEETMTLFQHWSATAGWLAARKRAKDRTGEPDWPDAMVSASSREREGEHVLTTNGMGYFWCSCDLHQAHVLWSLNEHIAEIADQSAAHDAALRARAEKAEQRLAQWRERMWVSVNERAVWMHEKGEHTGDLPYMPCPICEAGAAREAAAETRARAGRAAEAAVLALRVDQPLDDFQRGANAVLARAASIVRAAAEGGGQ